MFYVKGYESQVTKVTARPSFFCVCVCVFYVKRSRPLPREVLQCGRSSARAQAALPLAALPLMMMMNDDEAT